MAIDLIQSDCIQAMRQLDDNCIDLVLTDPPYNLASFMKNRDTNLNKLRENFFVNAGWDDMDFDDWIQSMDAFFEEAARVAKKGSAMIIFMAIIKVETIIRIARKDNEGTNGLVYTAYDKHRIDYVLMLLKMGSLFRLYRD